MISKTQTPTDLRLATGKLFFPESSATTKKSSAQSEFQQLLDKVAQETPPADAPTTEAPPNGELLDPPAQPQEPEEIDDAAAQAGLAALATPAAPAAPTAPTAPAAPAANEPPQQQSTKESSASSQAPVQVVRAVALPAQPQQPAAEATAHNAPSGDILSVQTATPPAETPPSAPPQQTLPSDALKAQDRFGEMLGQAQKQLDNMASDASQSGKNAQTIPPAAQEKAPPTSQQKPAGETPKSAPPAQQPVKAAQQTSSGEQPVKAAPSEGEQSAQSTQKTQVGEPPAKPVMEQKPLSEMPESDRAALQMKGAKSALDREQPAQALEIASGTQEPRAESAKLSEPQQPASPKPQAVQTEQIRVEMTKQLEQGKTEFRMQLQPEELGKISVKMILQGDRLTVEIIAAAPKAAELLQRQTDSLLQSLRMQQFDVQSVSVVTETQSASGQMGSAFNMLNGQGRDGAQQQAGGSKFGASAEADADPTNQSGDQQHNPDALLDYSI